MVDVISGYSNSGHYSHIDLDIKHIERIIFYFILMTAFNMNVPLKVVVLIVRSHFLNFKSCYK